MASIIQIKRSTGAVAPTTLAPGELAYSFGTGTQSNLGDRLFFGAGSAWNEGDQAFYAESIDVIGGKYFTAMLGAVPGTLTASSAIITDANSKISNIKVDNIDIDGNTISTTNLNGNLVLAPNGTGSVDVNGARISTLADPVNSQDAATRSWVLQQTGSIAPSLGLRADTTAIVGGVDEVNTVDSDISILGGTGISTVLTDNTITINLDNTSVSAGTYGSATSVPGFSVDAQGRITGVTAYAIDNIDSAAVVQEINLVVDAAFVQGLQDYSYSSLSGVPTNVSTFTNDAGYAVLASLTTDDIPEAASSPTNLYYTTARADADFDTRLGTKTTDNIVTEGSTNLWYTGTRATDAARDAVSATDAGGDGSLSYNSGTGVFTYTGPSASETRAHFSAGTGITLVNGEIALGQAAGTTDDVTFASVTTTGNVVVGGNLQVNGTTVTINSETISISDNMLYLNSEESDGSVVADIDLGWAGAVNDQGSYYHVGMFRDATDETFKVYHEYTPEPDASVQIDTSHASFKLAPFAAGTLTGKYLGFDSDVATLTTDDIAEGSNLYYLTSRADSDAKNAISVSGNGIAYNSGTGVISTSDASTTVKGVASFATGNFAVASGVVTTNTVGITGNSGAGASVNNGGSIAITATVSSGVVVVASETGVAINVANATYTTKGTASFDINQFTVTGGAVSLATIDGGTF
jgi:trimeric autotransporter adhesin